MMTRRLLSARIMALVHYCSSFWHCDSEFGVFFIMVLTKEKAYSIRMKMKEEYSCLPACGLPGRKHLLFEHQLEKLVI